MPHQVEGYVYHTYGPERYIRNAVASVSTLRRHDDTRPVALYCTSEHRRLLSESGLDSLFSVIRDLPDEHASIIGFKHHLHKFMPFDECMFVDADMIWCRNPDKLWQLFEPYTFTATGLERADFFFGGPKGITVLFDYLLDRRRRTMKRFGITSLPRVQAGMVYARSERVTRTVCEQASEFLDRRSETHFRSRLDEGRSEESCEWSLAMAMSKLGLPVLPWYNAKLSPQLDYVDEYVDVTADFEDVRCLYYNDAFVFGFRGVHNRFLRGLLHGVFSRVPGKGDHQFVTPFALHFGWIYYKDKFHDFADSEWTRLANRGAEVRSNGRFAQEVLTAD